MADSDITALTEDLPGEDVETTFATPPALSARTTQYQPPTRASVTRTRR